MTGKTGDYYFGRSEDSSTGVDTAATSPWVKTARASAPTPACSPACAASPSTSSRQTKPTRSAKIATALVSQASGSYSECSMFHSVEQPWPQPNAANWIGSNADSGRAHALIPVVPRRAGAVPLPDSAPILPIRHSRPSRAGQPPPLASACTATAWRRQRRAARAAARASSAHWDPRHPGQGRAADQPPRVAHRV